VRKFELPDTATKDTARELHLVRRYHRQGDRRARDELVARLLPLARTLARRYARTGEPLDDLFQVASLGLVKAIDRFDIEAGDDVRRFAVPTMLGELKRYLRDTRWALRIPRELQERALEVGRWKAELGAALGHSPTPADIARASGCDEAQVLEALGAFGTLQTQSLDAPIDADGDGSLKHELLGVEDPSYEYVEDAAALEPGIAALSRHERRVLKLRFVEDLTQNQIGARIGVSQMQVSRLIQRALDRIREESGLSQAA
jgi:RNA polymerase sigma-B factor